MDRELPEAKSVVYTTVDVRGFEVSTTVRGDSNDPKTLAEVADQLVRAMEAKGFKAVVRGKFGGFPKKEQRFTGKKCPLCGADTVEVEKKDGTGAFEKCSTNKWDPATKQSSGCNYINFGYQKV